MTNEKTRAFRVEVTLANKTIPAGKPIKIGATKDAISKEEADKIDLIHGPYTGDKPVAPADTASAKEIAALTAKLEAETKRADDAEALVNADGDDEEGGEGDE